VILVLAALLGSVALLGACGESDQEKAQNRVCDARDDIQKHVDDLAGLTVTSASIDQVTNHLKAIRDDLKKIADERDNLSDDQRKDVEQAAQRFVSELRGAAGDVVSGTASGEDASKKASAALDDLAKSFKDAYAPLDCG
jgi:methyl-accepting chemotaxis protein